MSTSWDCTKCGSAFVPSSWQTRKFDRRCKACRNEYERSRKDKLRAAGVILFRDKDRAAEYERERMKRPEVKARRAAAMRRYQTDPRLRARHEARWKVRRAIASGALVRGECECCGSTPTHGHHDDYTKPFAVRWLCTGCHGEWHKHNTPVYPDARCGGAP